MSSLTVLRGRADAPGTEFAEMWAAVSPGDGHTFSPEAVTQRWPGSDLLIAVREGVPCGRSVLSPMKDRSRHRPPQLTPHVSQDEAVEIAKALATRARELTDPCALVEAFPADDVDNDAAWRAGMVAAGYHEIAAARLWERSTAARDVRSTKGLDLVLAGEVNRRMLEDLIADVRSDTADRVDIEMGFGNPSEVIAQLGSDPVASPVPELWLVALERDGGNQVGYVFGSSDDDGDLWVVDVGVRPAFRNRGLGAELLRALIARGAAAGHGVVRAQIDVANAPSESAHRKAGFAARPHLYRTWRAAGIRGQNYLDDFGTTGTSRADLEPGDSQG